MRAHGHEEESAWGRGCIGMGKRAHGHREEGAWAWGRRSKGDVQVRKVPPHGGGAAYIGFFPMAHRRTSAKKPGM